MRDRLPALRERFNHERGRLFISVVTQAELAFGSLKSSDPPRNDARLARLVEHLSILPFGSAAVDDYAAIRLHLERSGSRIGPNDLLIAAQARAASLVMVTGNRREFDRVPGLVVENWLV
jgi:tRNA(fMet)-specific endonuclease VapC